MNRKDCLYFHVCALQPDLSEGSRGSLCYNGGKGCDEKTRRDSEHIPQTTTPEKYAVRPPVQGRLDIPDNIILGEN